MLLKQQGGWQQPRWALGITRGLGQFSGRRAAAQTCREPDAANPGWRAAAQTCREPDAANPGCCERAFPTVPTSSASIALAEALLSPLCSSHLQASISDEPHGSEKVGREPWPLPSQVGALLGSRNSSVSAEEMGVQWKARLRLGVDVPLCDPLDSSPPGSSSLGLPRQVYTSNSHFLLQGIFLTQVLNKVFCFGWWIFYHLATRKPGVETEASKFAIIEALLSKSFPQPPKGTRRGICARSKFYSLAPIKCSQIR